MVRYGTNRAGRPSPVPSDFWSPMDSIGVRKSGLLIEEMNYAAHHAKQGSLRWRVKGRVAQTCCGSHVCGESGRVKAQN